MAGSLNKVLLIGRLGADPEIKQMVNGKSVARLSLATSQSWKDKSTGEKKEKTWVVGLWIQIHIGICRFNTRFFAISPQIAPDDGVNIEARWHRRHRLCRLSFIPPWR